MRVRLNRWAIAFLTAAIIAMTTVPAYSASVLIVTNTDDSGPGSLRDTLASATYGDTIRFDDALLDQTITLTTSSLNIWVGISIEGLGPNHLAVRRSSAPDTPAFSVFTVNSGSGIGPSVSIAGLTISNGSADYAGGGIFSDAPAALTISNCALSDNHAPSGGGIYCNSRVGDLARFPTFVTITNSTISGNSADSAGGIFVAATHGLANYAADLTLTNSTISGNVATSTGGGIFIENAEGVFQTEGLVKVINTTVTGNSANQGGGIYIQGGENRDGTLRKCRNTIIAGNTASIAPDLQGNVNSDGFNFIGDSSNAIISPMHGSDLIGAPGSPIDPLLGPLQNNGGSTQTHAPLPGSPVIDKGHASGSTTDQRGFVRPIDLPDVPNATGGDGADIGAVEVVGATLGNISTRLRIATNHDPMIGGFIITGTEAKTVIVRGIGPSLPLPGALADPIIEVHGFSGELLATNDDWRDADSSPEIMQSGLAPTNDLESALWGIISPASYTVVLSGKNGASGVGLFEVYDLDQTVNSRLGNISTRGFVGTDNDVMVSGTIILGNNPGRVLVRAIGPSLAGFGVADALQDPTLELHDATGALVQSNDNWRDTQEAEIIATGIPPTNDLESAIVRDLSPGSYTAILRGKDGTTGVGLVEVYNLN